MPKLKPITVLYTDGTFENMMNRTVFRRYPGVRWDLDAEGRILFAEGVEQEETRVFLEQFEERAVVWVVDTSQDPPKIVGGSDTTIADVVAHHHFKNKKL